MAMIQPAKNPLITKYFARVTFLSMYNMRVQQDLRNKIAILSRPSLSVWQLTFKENK